MKLSLKYFLIIFFLSLLIIPKNDFAQTSSLKLDSAKSFGQVSDSSKQISPFLFTYAGDRRYTLSGQLPNLKTNIKPTTTLAIGGIFLTAAVWLHIHQQNAWWSGQRRNFHFQEDWVSAMQVDKAGHAYGGYMTAYVMSEGLMASGFSWDDATLWGTIFGIAYQTYVETEDGFAQQWGFSPSDWYFDTIGPIFFLSQHYVPALQNITPKWQFVPSEWTGKPVIIRPRTFIDDYNSSTFWWSINIYNILPDNMRKYWIPWLNIAIGYGADAIDANRDPNGSPDQYSQRRFAVGLDYNLVKLLPDGGWFWNWFRQSLNFIKFPAPAVEFSSSGTSFKLLYPFRISLGSIKF
jgi:hypothetical protein